MNKNLIAGIFEDKRSFLDRYTVVIKNPVKVMGRSLHQAFSLDAEGKSPHWLMVFYNPEGDNSHLGEQVSYDSLPNKIQVAIAKELKDFERGGVMDYKEINQIQAQIDEVNKAIRQLVAQTSPPYPKMKVTSPCQVTFKVDNVLNQYRIVDLDTGAIMPNKAKDFGREFEVNGKKYRYMDKDRALCALKHFKYYRILVENFQKEE